ncbi:PIN domain-containing protein [Adlercreutzia muris]|uniref:PIN domain-containing protein n=1 Tax=Adlercreutzia muris TaxID=1796610 RepID=UPI0013651912|nr:PIN domain-containing protein [Adlercreutzia muris]
MSNQYSAHRYICFDTCVLVDCALCLGKNTRSDLLDAIFQRMDETNTTLLMLDVIDAELDNVMKRRGEDAAHSLNEIVESVNRVAAQKTLPANNKDKILSAIAKAKQSTRENEKDLVDNIRARAADPEKGVLLHFCTKDIEEAIRMSIAGKHPAKAKHSDGLVQADCLIAACLKRHIEDNPDSEVVFCSSNIADFAQADGDGLKLHPDLDEYWSGAVRYFSDPNDLHKWLASLEGELTEEEENELEDYSQAYESAVCLSNTLKTSTNLEAINLSESVRNYIHLVYDDKIDENFLLQETLTSLRKRDGQSRTKSLARLLLKLEIATKASDIMKDECVRSELVSLLRKSIDNDLLKDTLSEQLETRDFADLCKRIYVKRANAKPSDSTSFDRESEADDAFESKCKKRPRHLPHTDDDDKGDDNQPSHETK